MHIRIDLISLLYSSLWIIITYRCYEKHNTKDTVYWLMMQQKALGVMIVMVNRSEYGEWWQPIVLSRRCQNTNFDIDNNIR